MRLKTTTILFSIAALFLAIGGCSAEQQEAASGTSDTAVHDAEVAAAGKDELIARGEQIREFQGHLSRKSAQLACPKSGTALLAVQSKAPILPVGLLGTEKTIDNMRRWRRTAVTLCIGPVFGPMEIDPILRGPSRRRQLDEMADLMMQQIAALFPVENRGPYAGIELQIFQPSLPATEPNEKPSTWTRQE